MSCLLEQIIPEKQRNVASCIRWLQSFFKVFGIVDITVVGMDTI